MVFYFNEFEAIDGCFCKKVSAYMPREKAERYAKCREAVRVQGCCGHALLMYALSLAGKSPDSAAHFVYGENEKPYLSDGSLFFNVSHCSTTAACAVSENEIGLDVQEAPNKPQRAASRVCIGGEIKESESFIGFARVWSRKEAVLKRFGNGIADMASLPDLSFCSELDREYKTEFGLIVSYQTEKCVLSVCSETSTGNPVRVSAKEICLFVDKLTLIG